MKKTIIIIAIALILAGSAFFCALYWDKIKSFFTNTPLYTHADIAAAKEDGKTDGKADKAYIESLIADIQKQIDDMPEVGDFGEVTQSALDSINKQLSEQNADAHKLLTLKLEFLQNLKDSYVKKIKSLEQQQIMLQQSIAEIQTLEEVNESALAGFQYAYDKNVLDIQSYNEFIASLNSQIADVQSQIDKL